MNTHDTPDHVCGQDGCTIDWLFDPAGPADSSWMARVSAEASRDLFLGARRLVS